MNSINEIYEALLKIDHALFFAINNFNSVFFDHVMFFISEIYIWIPLYIILLWLSWLKYKKMLPLVIIIFILTVVLTDQVSVHLFKNVFERLRPCHNPEFEGLVHLVNNKCGGKFGFVSSHACNTAGVATISILLLHKPFRWITPVVIFYVILNSYSRIYLGVHYPADVIGGLLVGIMAGFISYWILLLFPKINHNMLKTNRLQR